MKRVADLKERLEWLPTMQHRVDGPDKVSYWPRYPRLDEKNGPINYKRVNGATAVNINLFFDPLEVPEIANTPLERFFNVDEMGMGQGVGEDHWVISDALMRHTFKKAIEKGEWTMALECVSVGGEALPSLLIWKGFTVQAQWFPDKNRSLFEDWRFDCSSNGWASNLIAIK